VGRNNPKHQYMLRANRLETSFEKKDLGVLLESKLTTSQQCTLAAKKAILFKHKTRICHLFPLGVH